MKTPKELRLLIRQKARVFGGSHPETLALALELHEAVKEQVKKGKVK